MLARLPGVELVNFEELDDLLPAFSESNMRGLLETWYDRDWLTGPGGVRRCHRRAGLMSLLGLGLGCARLDHGRVGLLMHRTAERLREVVGVATGVSTRIGESLQIGHPEVVGDLQ